MCPPPTENSATAADHVVAQHPAAGDQGLVDYENDDADLMHQFASEHGHRQQSGLVQGQDASAVVDSGASFNALGPQFAARIGLRVHDYPRPLTTRLGGGICSVMSRRVAKFSFSLPDFRVYTTAAFLWTSQSRVISCWACRGLRRSILLLTGHPRQFGLDQTSNLQCR